VFVVVTFLLVDGVHTTAGTSASAGSSPTATTHPPSTTTTTAPAVPPGKVPVLVANGSGTSGLAGGTSNELQAAGWDVLPPVNATSTVPDTTVYYAAGSKAPATSIATQLHLPATSVQPLTTSTPVATVGTADVVVVLGTDQTKTTASTA
jgi:hypothetical protein